MLLLAALLVPALDLVGRALAPVLLSIQPAALLAVSPTGLHLLLVDVDPFALAVGVVIAARLSRSWIIYAACLDQVQRIQSSRHHNHPGAGGQKDRSIRNLQRIRQLLVPPNPPPRTRHLALATIALIPGPVSSAIAARSQIRHRQFGTWMLAATLTHVAVTLVAAARFRPQLRIAAQILIDHPVQAGAVILTLALLGRLRSRPVLARTTLGAGTPHPQPPTD